MESGDKKLLKHNSDQERNYSYLYSLPRIKNKIIIICEKLIINKILNLVNVTYYFSVIADEAADIFIIGIRVLNK